MIFLVGHRASGKTEVAKILERRFHIIHVETSSIVKDFKAVSSQETEMDQWEEGLLNRFGRDFINELIVEGTREKIEKKHDPELEDVVISGNRQASGVDYLIRNIGELPNDIHSRLHLVTVVVDPRILYKRYVLRGRRDDAVMDEQEFYEGVLERERTRGLSELMQRPHISIDNSGDLAALEERTFNLFRELGYRARERYH